MEKYYIWIYGKICFISKEGNYFSSKYQLCNKDLVNPGYSVRRRSLCLNIC